MSEQIDESEYYSISKAYKEIRSADGAVDTTLAGVTMLGKIGFNVGRFTLTEILPAMLEKQANIVLNNPDSTEEQREKAEESRSKADKVRQHAGTGKYKKEKNNDD